MKHILVTGCAGFIGSHLAEQLLRRGYKVTGLDCFTTNYSKWIKQLNLEKCQSFPQFTFIKGDLRSLDLKRLLQDKDFVFHQAALPGVRSSWGKDFKLYVEHNILATQQLLEAMKESQVQKLIYASSSSVYGYLPEGPIPESQSPSPYSPYGLSKLAGEQLCQLYYKNYGLPVVSLRYFTVYGPGQRPDMAFHIFIKHILQDSPLQVYGDGKQTRDFTYIHDAVQANLLAMERGISGEAYNIGGNSRVELQHVIHLLGQIIGKEPRITFGAKQDGDPDHTWADISKAQAELGYHPGYSLEKGLDKQVTYIQRLYEL